MIEVKDFEYSEDNHLQCGLKRLSDGRPAFVSEIGECRRRPDTPIQEASRAARKIYDSTDGDIILLMGGGVDSEAMARAFLSEGIPFRVAIGRYSQALNENDIMHARLFCKSMDIDHEYIDIDLMDFFLSGKYLEYGRKYHCRSPQLAVHLEILEKLRGRGLPILAWNPCEIARIQSVRAFNICIPTEPHSVFLRYFRQEALPGVPYFFAYSPELIFSFWYTDQFLKELKMAEKQVHNRLLTQVQSYLGKVEKYRQGGFDVRPRDGKRTGFEEVKALFRDYFLKTGEIRERYPGGCEPFDYKFRKPLEKMNPYPESRISVVPQKYFPSRDLMDSLQKRHELESHQAFQEFAGF